MSNTSLGKGEKGSKYWMQRIVNSELKPQLDALVGDNLKWLSPLEDEAYREYELHETEICNAVGIADSEKAFAFWPNRQPQWDGIAVSDDTQTLYLVEAKAHLQEMESSCAAGETSRKIIADTMKTVQKALYADGTFEKWMNGYYQLGNRLTFLQKMKEQKLEKYPNVKLILLHIVNDFTYRPTTAEAWEQHLADVFETVTGNKQSPKDVSVIYFDVNGLDKN